MRRKRRSTARKTPRGKLIVLLFVIIPLIGIAIGYGVAKMLIIPRLTQNQQDILEKGPDGDNTEIPKVFEPDPLPDPPGDNDDATRDVQRKFTVEGIEIYRIQIGAFSDMENALKLAEELRDKNLAASMDDDGMVKVYTHYLFSRDQAETVLKGVRNHYKDAYISRASYPLVHINFRGSYASEAGLLTEQLKKCKGMIIEIAAKDGAGDELEDIVREQRDRVTQFKAQISQAPWPADLEQYKDCASHLYTVMLGSYFDYDGGYYMPGQISMELINCYIKLLDQLNSIV